MQRISSLVCPACRKPVGIVCEPTSNSWPGTDINSAIKEPVLCGSAIVFNIPLITFEDVARISSRNKSGIQRIIKHGQNCSMLFVRLPFRRSPLSHVKLMAGLIV